MDFPLYFQILRGRIQVFFLQARKQIFCHMACIYPRNSRGVPQSLDVVITHVCMAAADSAVVLFKEIRPQLTNKWFNSAYLQVKYLICRKIHSNIF